MRLTLRVVLLAILFLTACAKTDKKRLLTDGKPPLPKPILSSLSGPSYVEVEFSGIISHVIAGTTRRAVLVRDLGGGHVPLLTLPLVYKTAIEDVMGGTCEPHFSYPQCSIPLNNVALRIVSGDDAVPQPRYSLADFVAEPTIPHLKRWIEQAELHDDVLDDFPDTPNGPVAAWFSLDAGEAIPTPFAKCKGNFPDEPMRRFNRFVTLSLFTRQKAELQVKRSRNADWERVRLGATRVFLRVSNDPKKPTDPHFHLFGNLADPPKAIPNVIPEKDCTEGVGTVPGCSNSTWP